MRKTHRNREYWFARLTCILLIGFAIWQPLPAIAALVSLGCAFALAGCAACQRIIGRLA